MTGRDAGPLPLDTALLDQVHALHTDVAIFQATCAGDPILLDTHAVAVRSLERLQDAAVLFGRVCAILLELEIRNG